jgi:hypothetical protein
MTIQRLKDMQTPIGAILEAAGAEGVVLETDNQQRYAVVPLDGDMLDYLLERSPKFIEACRDIQGRMRAGNSQTHESAKKLD